MKLEIRPFQPADQAAARKLILEGLGDHFGYIDESLNPDLDDIAANYAEPDNFCVVAANDAGLIATGALQYVDGNVAQMVRISVARVYRRLGIGRCVVSHLVDVARHRGIRRIQVETNRDWYDAIALYERQGFVLYDGDDRSVYLALDPTSVLMSHIGC